MSTPNAAQIEYWNGKVGERWARQQQRIDMNLSEIMKTALSFAGARPGEHALDVGCGCGSTTLALADAVGSKGAVTGVDISQPMLEVARARAAGAAIDFREADASDCAFKPEFDLVFSRFGVMFFADPIAAFANIRRALRPKGRLRFVCWRTAAENVWATAPFEAARALLPPQEAGDPNAPGPFAFGDRKRLEGILAAAGFRDIGIEAFDTVMNMGADPDEAAGEALSIGPLARAAGEVDEAARAKIREAVSAMMGQFRTPAGITPPAACWLVSAAN